MLAHAARCERFVLACSWAAWSARGEAWLCCAPHSKNECHIHGGMQPTLRTAVSRDLREPFCSNVTGIQLVKTAFSLSLQQIDDHRALPIPLINCLPLGKCCRELSGGGGVARNAMDTECACACADAWCTVFTHVLVAPKEKMHPNFCLVFLAWDRIEIIVISDS